MAMPDLTLFLGALVVAFLVPGPDMILMLRTGTARRPLLTGSAVAGLAVARAFHVTLSAIGLAAVIKTSPVAFDVIRYAGAAYLVWLGIGILRARSLHAADADGTAGAGTAGAAFRSGLLTNLLNPKALLFCSVLLPQFVAPEAGAVSLQFLLLGVILVATGATFDAVFGIAGQRIGAFVQHHRMVETLERWVFGSLLIGFGARLAATA